MADRSDDDFLTRWSRRKRATATDADRPGPAALRAAPPAQSAPATAEASPDAEAAPEPEGDPDVVAKLPDIDAMDDSSDFTVFLQDGVPEALRRRALRKLWRVNPVLANLDGLNDYDEDYTKLGMVEMPGLKTIYRIGRGMIRDDELEPEEAESAAAAPETVESETIEPELAEAEKTESKLVEPEKIESGKDEALSPGPDAPVPAAPRSAPGRGAARRRWDRFRT